MGTTTFVDNNNNRYEFLGERERPPVQHHAYEYTRGAYDDGGQGQGQLGLRLGLGFGGAPASALDVQRYVGGGGGGALQQQQQYGQPPPAQQQQQQPVQRHHHHQQQQQPGSGSGNAVPLKEVEWAEKALVAKIEAKRKSMRKVFLAIDNDRDGRVSLAEFDTLLRQLNANLVSERASECVRSTR